MQGQAHRAHVLKKKATEAIIRSVAQKEKFSEPNTPSNRFDALVYFVFIVPCFQRQF